MTNTQRGNVQKFDFLEKYVKRKYLQKNYREKCNEMHKISNIDDANGGMSSSKS